MQDLDNTTPWSIITPAFGTFSGQQSSAGRKMLGMHPRLAAHVEQMRADATAGQMPYGSYYKRQILDATRLS